MAAGTAQHLPTAPQKRVGQVEKTNFTVHHVFVTNKASALCAEEENPIWSISFDSLTEII